MRVPPAEFLKLNLKVHSILSGVSLHDVTAVDLPGGGAGRTISDVRALLTACDAKAANPATRFLFKLRLAIGRAFAWDADSHTLPEASYLDQVGDDIKKASVVAPGTLEGPFQLLYVLENESLSEIQNATVHAFICAVLAAPPQGYRLYWGVYVIPVSRLSFLYLGIIEPFRRFIVYPDIFRRIRRAWENRYRIQADEPDISSRPASLS
jgi:hypothetical protein